MAPTGSVRRAFSTPLPISLAEWRTMRSTDINERLRRALIEPSPDRPIDPLDGAIHELAQAVMGSPLATAATSRPSENGWAVSLGARPPSEVEEREEEKDKR